MDIASQRRRPIRVVVAESRSGEATEVVGELRRRGHIVTSCAPPPGSTAPCRGLTPDGSCSLDDPVDVVIDVRNEHDVNLRNGDLPAVCAMRLDVPVVAAGPPAATARLTWAARQCSLSEAVDGCEALAALHTATH